MVLQLNKPLCEAPMSPYSFTQGTVFFRPEPLRGNPFPLLLSAECIKLGQRRYFQIVIE